MFNIKKLFLSRLFMSLISSVGSNPFYSHKINLGKMESLYLILLLLTFFYLHVVPTVTYLVTTMMSCISVTD